MCSRQWSLCGEGLGGGGPLRWPPPAPQEGGRVKPGSSSWLSSSSSRLCGGRSRRRSHRACQSEVRRGWSWTCSCGRGTAAAAAAPPAPWGRSRAWSRPAGGAPELFFSSSQTPLSLWEHHVLLYQILLQHLVWVRRTHFTIEHFVRTPTVCVEYGFKYSICL